MIKHLIITALCLCALIFCAYKLITAECSGFNYCYLGGMMLIPLAGADSVVKLLNFFKK